MANNDSTPEVVVITGPGSGIGRAIARRFAGPDAKVALVGRNEDSLEGAEAEIEEAGGEALVLPDRRRRRRRGRRGRGRGREGLRADRHLGQQLDDHGLLLLRGDRARGVPAGDRGHLPGHRVGHAGRAEADAAPRPRHDRAGRLGDGLPRDSAAVALLRRQARDEGLRRVAAHASSATRARRCTYDGPAARRQHAAVRPLPLEDAASTRCRCRPIYQPEVAADAVHWAAHHRRREVWVGVPTAYTIIGNRLAPWLAELYLAKTAVKGQQTDAPPTPKNSDGNLFSPHGGDPGAHGRFDDRRTRTRCSGGRRATAGSRHGARGNGGGRRRRNGRRHPQLNAPNVRHPPALECLGGNGYSETAESPVAQFYRDIQIGTVWRGIRQRHGARLLRARPRGGGAGRRARRFARGADARLDAHLDRALGTLGRGPLLHGPGARPVAGPGALRANWRWPCRPASSSATHRPPSPTPSAPVGSIPRTPTRPSARCPRQSTARRSWSGRWRSYAERIARSAVAPSARFRVVALRFSALGAAGAAGAGLRLPGPLGRAGELLEGARRVAAHDAAAGAAQRVAAAARLQPRGRSRGRRRR